MEFTTFVLHLLFFAIGSSAQQCLQWSGVEAVSSDTLASPFDFLIGPDATFGSSRINSFHVRGIICGCGLFHGPSCMDWMADGSSQRNLLFGKYCHELPWSEWYCGDVYLPRFNFDNSWTRRPDYYGWSLWV